jgi:hypothetical protein
MPRSAHPPHGASRFQAFVEANRDQLGLDRLRDGVPPLTAVMMASRFFIQYYGVELVFGVPNHFGVDDDTALKQIVDILKYGMFKEPRR